MWAVKEFTKRRKCRESKRMRDEVQRHHPKNIRFNPFVCLKLDVRLQTESSLITIILGGDRRKLCLVS